MSSCCTIACLSSGVFGTWKGAFLVVVVVVIVVVDVVVIIVVIVDIVVVTPWSCAALEASSSLPSIPLSAESGSPMARQRIRTSTIRERMQQCWRRKRTPEMKKTIALAAGIWRELFPCLYVQLGNGNQKATFPDITKVDLLRGKIQLVYTLSGTEQKRTSFSSVISRLRDSPN